MSYTSAVSSTSNVWYTVSTGGTTGATTWTDDYYIQPHCSTIENLPTEVIEAVIRRRGGVTLFKRRHAVLDRLSAKALKSCDPRHDERDLTLRTVKGMALPQGRNNYILPDGSVILLDDDGNYRIEDSEAEVVYKANRVREFNPYINASDLLEAFIGDLGKAGVKQTEVLHVPIDAFIHWLVYKASERDGDVHEGMAPVLRALPAPKLVLPRCSYCGRFLRRAWAAARVSFCSPDHMSKALARLEAA